MIPYRPTDDPKKISEFLVGHMRELEGMLKNLKGGGGTSTTVTVSAGGTSTTIVTGSTVKYGMQNVTPGSGTISYTAFSPAPSSNNEPMLVGFDSSGNQVPLRATSYSNGSIGYTVDFTGVILWVVGY